MKNNLRILIVIIAVSLIPLNNYICDYVYPLNDEASIKAWWYLKEDVYGVIIALVIISYSISMRGVLRFVLEVSAGLAISNVVDRLYFNVRNFTKADIIMIIATLLFAVIDYKKDGLTTNDKRATS